MTGFSKNAQKYKWPHLCTFVLSLLFFFAFLLLLTRTVAFSYSAVDGAGVTPGLRRRRERAERQRSLLREQYESNMRAMVDTSSSEDGI